MDDNLDLVVKLLNKQENNIKEFIKASNSVTHANMINEVGQVGAKVDQVIAHQKEQNGELVRHGKKMAEHEKRMVDLEKEDIRFMNYQRNCPANKIATKMTKRRFWIAATALFAVAYVVLATLWHTVGFGQLILRIVELL
jgi:multidrug resistance efflux pump